MKRKGGLKLCGNHTMRYDHLIIHDWLTNSNWEYVDYVAPAILPEIFYKMKTLGIDYKCYDIDPMFKNDPNYQVCDVIFDPIKLRSNIINFNAHKMYPIGKVYKGEFIITGTSSNDNGDCNPVYSVDQLIEQNGLHTIYDTEYMKFNNISVSIVWGRND